MRRTRILLPTLAAALLALAACSSDAEGEETAHDGEEPYVLLVHDPSGSFEITETHAARLDGLEGRTICELSDHMWEARRTFPRLREELTAAYPDLTIVTYDELPDAYGAEPEDLTSAVQRLACQGVIVGNAG